MSQRRRTLRIALAFLGGFALLFSLVLGVLFYRMVWSPPRERLPLPEGLIGLDTEEGRALLARSEARIDYDSLRESFVEQERGSFCGVASAVSALNALRAEGVRRGAALDQDAFFEGEAGQVRSFREVLFGGMTVEQLGALIRAHGVRAEVTHAEEGGYEAFLEAARENLAREGDYLLVNFDRRALDEAGGGHHSPVAAYEEESGRLLLMDTAAYKYPPTWIPARALWEAMRGQDSSSGQSRGYVRVGGPEPDPE